MRATTSRARRVLFSTLPSMLLLAATAAAEPIVVANAPDLGFSHPQTSADGLVTALVRGHVRSDGMGGTLSWRDVYLLDLVRDCSNDLLREITSDGLGDQPSISDDASTLVYLSGDAARGWEVRSHDLATGVEVALSTETSNVTALDVARDGQGAAYLSGPAGARELIWLDLSGPIPIRVVAATGDLELAAERPISNGPVVYYAKAVAGLAQIHSWTPAGGEVQVTAASEDHGPPSASWNGDLAYLRTSMAGVRNLWAREGGVFMQLTFNADPSARIAEPAIDAAGSLVYFATTLDLTGNNSDLSWELFREFPPGGPTLQLTDRVGPLEYMMRGVTSGRQAPSANVYFGGSLTGVFPGSLLGQNSLALQLLTPDKTLAAPIPIDQDLTLVGPPFDVRADPPDLSPLPSCSYDGTQLECFLAVRNSDEDGRSLIIIAEWEITGPAGCEEEAGEPMGWSSLGPGEQLIVSEVREAAGPCSSPSGVFRVRAVGPTTKQHDLAMGEVPFSF